MSGRIRGMQDGGLPPHPRTTGYLMVRVLSVGGLVVAVATWVLFSDRAWAGPVGLVAVLVGLVCVAAGFIWRMTAVDEAGAGSAGGRTADGARRRRGRVNDEER
ncbi:hypothetical protein GCM10027055_30520 [Janibacter alkaliphilus]